MLRSTTALIYSVRNALGPGTLILGIWYAALVWIHARTIVGPASVWIVGAAALTAVALVGSGLRWLRRPPREGAVDTCVVGVALAVLANDAIYLFFNPEPQYLHGLSAVLVGGGLFLLSRLWWGVLAAGVAAIVLMSAVRSGNSEGWAQPAILLATSGALALVIHVWRRAYLRRLEFLRQESEGRRLELERSVAALQFEVSERERLQEQLLKTQNLESLGRMAGGVAHDFNNLLLIIRGNAELACDELPTSGRVRPHLDEVITAADRAALLTGQLLAYAGGRQVHLEPLELNAFVRGTVELARESLTKGAALELDLEEGELMVEGDAGQLQQIVMNLILNAREALPEKGGAIRVGTSRSHLDESQARELEPRADRPPGCYACLEVRDTGRGIAPEDRSHIFDPFFTTKNQGRGLGLAAALGIARIHGGGFSIESVRGSGSCFRLLVPVASRISAVAECAPAVTSLEGRSILVVDDEAAIRGIIRRVLERRGCSVLEAANGDEALARARASSAIDAAVLDMTMPGLSSGETLDRLRRARPGLPVLLSSGHEAERAAEHLVREPSVAFLQKPYRPSDLVGMLKALLDPSVREEGGDERGLRQT